LERGSLRPPLAASSLSRNLFGRPGALLACTLVPPTLPACGRPLPEVGVHVVDASVGRLVRGTNSVDFVGSRYSVLGFVFVYRVGEFPDAPLKLLDRVFGREVVDSTPLEVRVVTLVGGRVPVVSRDNAEFREPSEVLPGGLRVTADRLGDRTRGSRLTSLKNRRVKCLGVKPRGFLFPRRTLQSPPKWNPQGAQSPQA
jgi:hypothetical protein